MTISTEPSTFEYAREWLLSSQCFLRDAMRATAVELDQARDQARERIDWRDRLEEPDETDETTTPDTPPPINPRPLAIIRPERDDRSLVGTGSWEGRGTLSIDVEVIVPDEHRLNYADDAPETRAAKVRSRKEWARQLCNTIRAELMENSGRDDGAGNPYLNARSVNIALQPADPDEGEADDSWMAFVMEVPWYG